MESLHIDATKYTPEIEFDTQENILKISGKSTPENTFEFFEPIKKWLTDYLADSKKCSVIFNIPYFNSSSSRAIYDIFDILSTAQEAGSEITVHWEYAQNNENGEESGQEFQEDFTDLNINLVAIEN